MTGEFADLMLGYYGEAIAERDPKVVKLAKAHAKKSPITDRPADHLKPEWEALDAAAKALDGNDGTPEDTLTYAMFPQVAPKFFAARAEGPKDPCKSPVSAAKPAAAAKGADGSASITGPVSYDVAIGGRTHKVTVQPA
jgi:methylmalonyl-CoA carboxyltransferase 5S subunit